MTVEYKLLKGLHNFSPVVKEPYFSKVNCECCFSSLAGQRHEFTAIEGKHHRGRKIIVSCCVDCFGELFN